MVTLDVARRLERKLRESQLKTVMTRDSDVFIPLNDRVARRMRRRMQSLSAYILTIRVDERPTDSRLLSFRRVGGFGQRDPAKTDDHPEFRKWWNSHRKFSCAPACQLSCGAGGMRLSSNRSEGNQARDSEYRELLADRIAEAIVEVALRRRSLSHFTSGWR